MSDLARKPILRAKSAPSHCYGRLTNIIGVFKKDVITCEFVALSAIVGMLILLLLLLIFRLPLMGL
jgi:hypothetical protein